VIANVDTLAAVVLRWLVCVMVSWRGVVTVWPLAMVAVPRLSQLLPPASPAPHRLALVDQPCGYVTLKWYVALV